MSFIVPERASTDVRGLPVGYDPHMFYEYAISRRMRDAKGLEWLLYQYMPIGLIKSFAIAIDPFSSLKRTSARITKWNRHVERGTTSLLGLNSSRYEKVTRTGGTVPNWDNIPGHNSPFQVENPPIYVNSTNTYGTMPVLYDTRDDTSRKTRTLGSERGEFLKQSHNLYVPPRSLYRSKYQIHTNSPGSPPPNLQQVSWLRDSESDVMGPHAAYLPRSSYNDMAGKEKAFANLMISKNVLSMFNQVSPMRRDYSLFRNVVELRDLPRSVASLQQSLANLRNFYNSLPSGTWERIYERFKSSARDVPNEYLSYMFGWRQLYNDVSDLLKTPDRISKRINFLLRRADKVTTVRLKRPIPLAAYPYDSGFDYYTSPLELRPITGDTRVERSGELRIVMNAMFQFPDVMSPNFRSNEFARRLGVTPTPLDLYNLVPWSWLVDWFTGLNHYVEAISTINTDRQLVNWCMITCDLKSQVITTRSCRTSRTTSISTSAPSSTYVNVDYSVNSHTAVCEYRTILRKDVSTALSGVRTTADPSTLTTYQRSILGALLLQRTKFP